MRVINNLMVCCLRQGDWKQLHQLQKLGRRYHVQNPVVRGELLATEGEAEFQQGNRHRARRLIVQAKNYLGDAPTASWFTIRFLELRLDEPSQAEFHRRATELESKLKDVAEPRVVTVEIAIARVALQCGHIEIGQNVLSRLERTVSGEPAKRGNP